MPRGETLEPSTTILEAVLRCASAVGEGSGAALRSVPLWDRVFEFKYRRASAEEQAQSRKVVERRHSSGAAQSSPHAVYLETPEIGALLEKRVLEADQGMQRLGGGGGGGAEKLAQVLYLLQLLRLSVDVGRLARPTSLGAGASASSPGALVCGSVAAKFAYQLQDILAVCSGSLPAWVADCASLCPYLLPFKSRRDFFRLTSFGVQHALLHLQQGAAATEGGEGAGGAEGSARDSERPIQVQLQRQKVRVNRSHVLQCAEKVMGLPGGPHDLLEIEYHGEEGTGLGPTLEFYSLLSRELSQRSLGLWRTEELPPPAEPDLRKGQAAQETGVETDADRAWAPGGLFPEPYPPGSATEEEGKRRERAFRTLGFFVGRALKDSRLLDLDLSETFWKAALGRPLGLADLHTVDPALGSSLAAIMESSPAGSDPTAGSGGSLPLHGVRVEDLVLDFTLPGRSGYELCPSGASRSVTGADAEEYVRLVTRATLEEGVAPQLRAFRAGLNAILPLERLQVFTESEIVAMVAGERDTEPWSAQYLRDHLALDHGYDSGSPAIAHLVRVLSGFDGPERRAFLRFITGSPCLPYGGLAALRPKLTVVCKLPPGVASPQKGGPQQCDQGLPSVMTCANYLKLPPFSSEEVMRRKLLYVIAEGQGSFHLS